MNETEIMWFGSATALRNLPMPSSVRAVNVGSVILQPASVVRDLGVQLDGELSLLPGGDHALTLKFQRQQTAECVCGCVRLCGWNIAACWPFLGSVCR